MEESGPNFGEYGPPVPVPVPSRSLLLLLLQWLIPALGFPLLLPPPPGDLCGC